MILRTFKTNELERVCSFLKAKNHLVNDNYLKSICSDDNSISMIKEDKEINGVIICKKTADLLELINWESSDNELFEEVFHKASVKGFSRIVATEQAKSKARIKRLNELGFKAIKQSKGLFQNDNAVILVKELY